MCAQCFWGFEAGLAAAVAARVAWVERLRRRTSGGAPAGDSDPTAGVAAETAGADTRRAS